MGRVLALDIGDRRIGLALSDIMKIIANPLETYYRTEITQDIAYIVSCVAKNEVDTIVCGLPISMNGQENTQTEKTRAFTALLAQKCTVPIEFLDERLTTVSAERVLLEGNVRRDKRKEVIDKVAATIILQSYLQYKR